MHQVLQNDSNLFSLHPGDLTEAPVAMIRTIRTQTPAADMPDKTELVIEPDESSNARPVLKGWNAPGMEGFEVTGVVETRKGRLTRIK